MILFGLITGYHYTHNDPVFFYYRIWCLKMSFYDFDKDDLEAALPEYRFVKLIGEGAYGKVYLLEKK